MRLIELGKDRPHTAGKAKIQYRPPTDLTPEERFPVRRGSTIVLPDYSDLELFQLQDNWNQFIVCVFGHVWFGGTDENPFLVRMNPDVVHDYYKGGPTGFYKAIVPQQLSKLSDLVKTPFIRQGDIFALPMPFSWVELGKAFRIFEGESLPIKETKDTHLFGTRHILKGHLLEDTIQIYGFARVQLAEGEVQAPDHSPVTLKSVHALSQTRLLYSPENAD